MFHLKSAPPAAPLLEVVGLMERAGHPVALGGSGLLGALGLSNTARDWDLTTDASPDLAAHCLAALPLERVGPGPVHADHKLRLAGGSVEVICGFAIRAPGGIVRLPTIVSARAGEIPLGSPEVWAVAYALLGRREKSGLLLGWLDDHGAERGALERLRAEPLPPDVSARLGALRRV